MAGTNQVICDAEERDEPKSIAFLSPPDSLQFGRSITSRRPDIFFLFSPP